MYPPHFGILVLTILKHFITNDIQEMKSNDSQNSVAFMIS